MYFPQKVSACGDDYEYKIGNTLQYFTPGTWQTIEYRLIMNTPGVRNGTMQAWVDGVMVLDIRNFLFRDTGATFAIDMLYFSKFFGGGDQSWAPLTAQTADFDELIVSEKPITH